MTRKQQSKAGIYFKKVGWKSRLQDFLNKVIVIY